MPAKTNAPVSEILKYQLDVLKYELQSIDQTIERIDEITQSIKNWAIVTWAGTISLALGQPDLRKYVVFTALLPLIFWYSDGHWRHLQRRTIFRAKLIREFLNGEGLQKAFEQGRVVDFEVYDTTGMQHREDPRYKKFTSTWEAMNFKSVRNFYFGLALISLLLGAAFWFLL